MGLVRPFCILIMKLDPSYLQQIARRIRELEAAMAGPKHASPRKPSRNWCANTAHAQPAQRLRRGRAPAPALEQCRTANRAAAPTCRDGRAEREELEAALRRRQRLMALMPPDPTTTATPSSDPRGHRGGSHPFRRRSLPRVCPFRRSARLKRRPSPPLPSDLGGYKEIIFSVGGEASIKPHYGGGHRVSACPPPKQGRILRRHRRGAARVNQQSKSIEDLRIDLFCASGGGESQQTARPFASPTCPPAWWWPAQDERSQNRNREKPCVLAARQLVCSASRARQTGRQAQNQIGSGDRSSVSAPTTSAKPPDRSPDQPGALLLDNIMRKSRQSCGAQARDIEHLAPVRTSDTLPARLLGPTPGKLRAPRSHGC